MSATAGLRGSRGWSRRRFLRAGGLLAGAGPLVLPGRLFGQGAPSKQVAVGLIGLGRQAYHSNLPAFLAMDDVRVVAVCDVDAWRLEEGRKRVDSQYADGAPAPRGCAAFRDFRALLARPDIDAVMISTPDHWHVPIALAAVKAGKDVSCEKPLTLSVREGRALADAVKRRARVFRTDSEFRSLKNFHRIVELVRNGRIGRLRRIRTAVPKTDTTLPPQPAMPVPEELDYELWTGPAPMSPYTVERVHPRRDLAGRPGWMRVRDYCEGLITNWGTHLNDIAQWGNGTDRTGPVEVEARGTYPPRENLWNVLVDFEAHYRYANGVTLEYRMERPFIRFEGDEGWVETEFGKPGIRASKDSILDAAKGPGWVSLPRRPDKEDFIEAVKTRAGTMEDAEVGHRTCSLCQIAHIAIQLGGRKLRWDPATERFEETAANALLDRPSWRAPWGLETA